MLNPSIILCAPLPQIPFQELTMWRTALETALSPWLEESQTTHVGRFARGQETPQFRSAFQPATGAAAQAAHDALRAGLSRLLARALLADYLAGQLSHNRPETNHMRHFTHIKLDMDSLGRPRINGWQAAFSHSGQAAFCAVRPAPAHEKPASMALDAEWVAAPPPDGRAFAPDERAALPPRTLGNEALNRDALRRWVIKEALLKALGTGLSRDPATVGSGRFGQRRGMLSEQPVPLLWRLVPCPGHWLCLVQAASGHTSFPLSRLVWQGPQRLPHLLRRLPHAVGMLCPHGGR